MTTNAVGKHNSRDKVRTYRQRMRARGLRPIQIWVPDTRTSTFREAAHSQSIAAAQSWLEQEDQGFVEAISELGGA